MNTARKLEYDYYDELAISQNVGARNFVEDTYKKRVVQAPHVRVLNTFIIFLFVFLIIFPLSLILSRHAQIHEKQYEIYRLKVKAQELDTKTSEIKERLESGISLDDLEVYATERVGMVKADRSKVIVLQSLEKKIKYPKEEFMISSGTEKELYTDENMFSFVLGSKNTD